MKVLAATAVALALAAQAAAAGGLSKADRAAISRSVDVFVNHAVKRVDPAAAYDVVAPELRAGTTRKQWAQGNIPVYPYPARGLKHSWTVLYAEPDEVGLELELLPRAGSKLGPIIFHVYVRPVHGRWLVDSFMPAANLAPLGNHRGKPAVVAAPDFSPAARGEGTGGGGPGRISGAYGVVPFAVVGLLLLGLAGWGVAHTVRDRRRFRAQRGTLPPPPRRVSRTP